MTPDRTNAERQRRYIARLKARAAEAPDLAALAARLAQAEAGIAELRREITHQPGPRPTLRRTIR